jgi:uncharacterized protein YbbK (DUF523 family)
MKIFLVSACLLGFRTRYDGRVFSCKPCRKALENALSIPVCPEQLGGLATPRIAADLAGGDGHDVLAGRARVVNRKCVDVTENFIRGARQILAIARQQQLDGIILKARSPSCGLSPVTGVTAALLQENGYEVIELG